MEDTAQQRIFTEPLPPFPVCTLFLYLLGIVVGAFLILIGCFEEASGIDPVKGATYMVSGAIVFAPCLFYTYLMLLALKTDYVSDFIRILRQVPQL